MLFHPDHCSLISVHCFVAVVVEFRRLVVARARYAVDEVFNRFRLAAQIIVEILQDNAARIGQELRPAGGAVGRAVDQDRVGTGRHGRRACVRRPAVSADVDGVGQTIRLVIVHDCIGNAGLRNRRRISQLARSGFVVEELFTNSYDNSARRILFVKKASSFLFYHD